MKNTIEKYFIAFGYLSLPNIGTIKLIKKDAILENGIWQAPDENILFETIYDVPSKHFYTYIADALSISNDHAILKYEQLLNDFVVNQKFELNGLGSFQIEAEHVLFNSHYNASNYFESISIESVKNINGNNNQIQIRKGDWFIWAFVITFLAIIAILIKNYL